MSKYLLADWERNQYHDSYFYATYYDDNKNEVLSEEFGATAFPSPHRAGGVMDKDGNPVYLTPDVEQVESARKVLEKYLFELFKSNEHNRVYTPGHDHLTRGTQVVTNREIKRKSVVTSEETCYKCNGSGNWVNPNNAEDVRDCLGCGGHGIKVVRTKQAVRDSDGKIVYDKYPKGLVGTIISDPTFFGTFYAKGYNKPDRSNGSVLVSFEQGNLWVRMEDLQLDGEPKSDDELLEEARVVSYSGDFALMSGARSSGLASGKVTKILYDLQQEDVTG